jgi:hypothetical protein
MKKLLLVLLALPMIGFGQNVNIPDATFKANLVGDSFINTNGDTEIQVAEAAAFTGTIGCSNMNISNLTGIEAFTALTILSCWDNQLTSLDVSNNIYLTYLRCDANQLTNLDVSANTLLTSLDCYRNQLTNLDLSQNTALTDLYCWNNQLTSLDVSQNPLLNVFYCSDNQITSLDVSQNTNLMYLSCGNNQLTSLDVSQNTALKTLNIQWEAFPEKMLSSTNILNYANTKTQNTPLTNLDLRNGNNSILNVFLCSGNSNLSCINVDNSQYSLMNWTGSGFSFDPQHYFSNNCPPSAVQEQTTNKELLKVTDLLGRETKATNQLLFYIYNDGTVEKKVVIE